MKTEWDVEQNILTVSFEPADLPNRAALDFAAGKMNLDMVSSGYPENLMGERKDTMLAYLMLALWMNPSQKHLITRFSRSCHETFDFSTTDSEGRSILDDLRYYDEASLEAFGYLLLFTRWDALDMANVHSEAMSMSQRYYENEVYFIKAMLYGLASSDCYYSFYAEVFYYHADGCLRQSVPMQANHLNLYEEMDELFQHHFIDQNAVVAGLIHHGVSPAELEAFLQTTKEEAFYANTISIASIFKETDFNLDAVGKALAMPMETLTQLYPRGY